MIPEYDFIDLGGGSFAVMRKESEGWRALYRLETKEEAIKFVNTCRSADKAGIETRYRLACGMGVG
jgi:hypothetical protein